MTQFVGTHLNRLDAKGRVSVPAAFRAALRSGLAADEPTTVMLRPSHKYDCVECWPVAKFERLVRSLDSLDPLSDEYDDRSTVIFGDTTQVDLDKEGRIVLTPALASCAKLTDRVAFMGMGETFHIWEPEAVERRRAEARAGARRDNSRPVLAQP